MQSEQLLGSVYRGICVRTTVMFAKSVSNLVVWDGSFVCVIFLVPPFKKTSYWLSKTKQKEKMSCLGYLSAMHICAYIHVGICAHICI